MTDTTQGLQATRTRNDVAVKEPTVMELSPVPKEYLIKLQQFQKQLDHKPDHRKVVRESIAGEQFDQLPITYIEHLLKKFFFGMYKIEVVSFGMQVNEVCVHVRLSVFHPILGQWLSYDGLAAVPVMMDSGSKVNEFMMKKKPKALAKNLPACYSMAIKNAAKKIGKVFGGDLNRKHEDTYEAFAIKEQEQPLNE